MVNLLFTVPLGLLQQTLNIHTYSNFTAYTFMSVCATNEERKEMKKLHDNVG